MEKDELLPAREVAIREFNSLRGRLCTVIESAGLPKKQERALVLLIKNLSYQNQAVIAELIAKLETHSHQTYRNFVREYDLYDDFEKRVPFTTPEFKYTEDKLDNGSN